MNCISGDEMEMGKIPRIEKKLSHAPRPYPAAVFCFVAGYILNRVSTPVALRSGVIMCCDKISWIKVIEDIKLATFYFRHMEGSRYANILGSL